MIQRPRSAMGAGPVVSFPEVLLVSTESLGFPGFPIFEDLTNVVDIC